MRKPARPHVASEARPLFVEELAPETLRIPSTHKYPMFRKPDKTPAKRAFFQAATRSLFDHALPKKHPAITSGMIIGT
jgi:hypothetical protein